jgi:hypothetical protein
LTSSIKHTTAGARAPKSWVAEARGLVLELSDNTPFGKLTSITSEIENYICLTVRNFVVLRFVDAAWSVNVSGKRLPAVFAPSV